MAYYQYCEEHNGIEIYFEDKPKQEILRNLSENGWHWHKTKKCWYQFKSEKNLKKAKEVCASYNKQTKSSVGQATTVSKENESQREKIEALLRDVQEIGKKIQLLEEQVIQNKQEEEEIQRKKRVQRRRKQVISDFDKAIKMIKTGAWKFSMAERDKTQSGFVWKSEDQDGILIEGKVGLDFTDIKIRFDEDVVSVDKTKCKELEGIILSERLMIIIEEWKTRKQEIHQEQSKRQEEKMWKWGNYEVVDDSPKCIYCGKETLFGNVCESCKSVYQKKRKGMGGYPCYDPYA